MSACFPRHFRSPILAPFVMLIVFLFILASQLLSNPAANTPAIIGSHLIPLCFIAGVLGFAVVLGRRDRVFLLDLLQQTVGGQMHAVTEETVSRATVAR